MNTSKSNQNCMREYDFSLILTGADALTQQVENALFQAGCDDATLSLQYGNLYLDFSRRAESFKDGILSAIRDVRRAGLDVLRADDCSYVTQAEIAHRTNRSRQQIHQYITGQRGPGGFPAPECALGSDKPLWAWCSVSRWLVENNMLRPEVLEQAEVIAAVNAVLDSRQQEQANPELFHEIGQAVSGPL